MSAAGFILLLAFLVGVIAVIVWPLLPGQRDTMSEGDGLPDVVRLQAQHEAILIAVRDLDFDYQTGKFTEEDYLAQRENLMQSGVEILKQIDARQSNLIEEAVSARRGRGRKTQKLDGVRWLRNAGKTLKDRMYGL